MVYQNNNLIYLGILIAISFSVLMYTNNNGKLNLRKRLEQRKWNKMKKERLKKKYRK